VGVGVPDLWAAEVYAMSDAAREHRILRAALRELLHRVGVASHPAVGDPWLVEQLARLLWCESPYAVAAQAVAAQEPPQTVARKRPKHPGCGVPRSIHTDGVHYPSFFRMKAATAST